MQKILEKFMKKYWKNAKKTGKVREIRQSKKVGTMRKSTTEPHINTQMVFDKKVVRHMTQLIISFVSFIFVRCGLNSNPTQSQLKVN